jgi:hypothetical protein
MVENNPYAMRLLVSDYLANAEVNERLWAARQEARRQRKSRRAAQWSRLRERIAGPRRVGVSAR